MPQIRVDFYILTANHEDAKWYLACQLLEKAYHLGHRAFVFCSDPKDALYLDERLWNFKEAAFIPHHLQGDGPLPPPPVEIGFGAKPNGFHDLLFNFGEKIPDFSQEFKRIIEIIPDHPNEKQIARDHYRIYRNQGHQLHTHHLNQSLKAPSF